MSPQVPWAGGWAYVGECSCGAQVAPDSFRDAESWRDYGITGLCQRCQDRIYFAASASDSSWRFPLRRGVLAASIQRECGLELGTFPFLFVAPESRVAWEARFLVRAGPDLQALDPWSELALMRPALETHQLRLTQYDDVGAIEVQAEFDVDLVLVLDEVASSALDRLPFAVDALRVVLSDLPWGALYGASLPSLLDRWVGGIAGSSVLRTCAALALTIDSLGAGAFFPFAYVIASHSDRFPELDWCPPDDSL